MSGKVNLKQQPLSFGIGKGGNIISRKLRMLSDVLKLRKLLKDLRPDLTIATEYPFAAAAILSGSGKFCKIISWEHHHYFELEKNAFWEKIFRQTYSRLDAVVCLNEDEKRLFEKVNSRVVVIPNFVSRNQPAVLEHKQLLTVGRLTRVKGTDLLLKTAGIVLKQHPDWQWKLIGDGEMKKEAEAFIEQENLKGRLILQPPAGPAIMNEYRGASIYVMTSRNECFPMTLLEAQSAGLPCIAFDCETGPRHILSNQQNGLLVKMGDIQAMAASIDSLITDTEKRKAMGNAAWQSVLQFDPALIYKSWAEKFLT